MKDSTAQTKQPPNFTRKRIGYGRVAVMVNGQQIGEILLQEHEQQRQNCWTVADIKLPDSGDVLYPFASTMKAAQRVFARWRGQRAEVLANA